MFYDTIPTLFYKSFFNKVVYLLDLHFLLLVTIFLFKNDLKLFRQATDIFSGRNYAADLSFKNASKFI